MVTGKRGLRRALIACCALAITLSSCDQESNDNEPVGHSPTVAVPEGGTGTIEERGAAAAKDARYVQTFEQATITDEIPDGQQLPADRTIASKPTGPLHAAVRDMWSKIVLTDDSGNPRVYVVTVETRAGTFEITLKPEWAPNHVRNFIALATVGYYDGLCFDRVVHQSAVTADGEKHRVDLVKGGCPLGTGEGGFGHIGYFMKPEPPVHLKHEEGTVGFWRDAHPGSAGCRFYITLGPAPTIDGEFALIGKVTKGLEVVKDIASRPVQDLKTYPECERPIDPVGIKKITVTPGYNQR
jgi:peptidyl-prolyl cis-trans isomerase B (cyclophilin B)